MPMPLELPCAAWKRSLVVALCFTSLLAGSGCGSDTGPTPGTDSGTSPRDGGSLEDGATPPADAGPPTDTGPRPDTGPADGGIVSMPCMASGACDPFDVDSCGATQGCRISSTTGTMCVDLAASVVPEGGTCRSSDECARGTTCLDFGDGSTCMRMCPEGSVGFCGATATCSGTLGHPCIQVCRPLPDECDIYAQDCTTAGEHCTFVTNPETRAPFTGCRPVGDRGEGETCGGMDGSCGFDLVCIRTEGVTACRQPCDPGDATDTCPTGQACSGFARTWMVGFCAPMAP